jgi:hypothetical protein
MSIDVELIVVDSATVVSRPKPAAPAPPAKPEATKPDKKKA